MKSKLSTDELFHFTKFANIVGIIENGFQPRYNLEHTFLSDLFERPAAVETIPMVCFCDIPLDMVREHSNKYGKCAIGLNKTWGETYGVSPVIYVHKNSRIGDAISALGNSFKDYKASMINDESDFRIFAMISTFAKGQAQLSYYLKQYERLEDELCIIGNNRYKFKKGRFYDEREWRFVPPNISSDHWIIEPEILFNESELEKAHLKLIKHSLHFNMEDIRYIICETWEQKGILLKTIADKYKVGIDNVLEKINIKVLDTFNDMHS
jgi:hypothetical protein